MQGGNMEVESTERISKDVRQVTCRAWRRLVGSRKRSVS